LCIYIFAFSFLVEEDELSAKSDSFASISSQERKDMAALSIQTQVSLFRFIFLFQLLGCYFTLDEGILGEEK